MAKRLGVPLSDLRVALQAFVDKGATEYILQPESTVTTLTLRGIYDAAGSTLEAPTPCALFAAALDARPTAVEPLLTWDGTNDIAAVDLDANDWTDDRLTSLLVELQPKPSFAWVTHGAGLRLIYVADGAFTAEEAAALAIAVLAERHQYERIELKASTRHPAFPRGPQLCGPVHAQQQSVDCRSLRSWLEGYGLDRAAVDAWLHGRGLTIGQRYGHECCPHDPRPTTGNSPIWVGDYGIHCFVCDRFAPYASLIERRSESSDFAICLRKRTHWTHARHIVARHLRLDSRVMRLTYATGIKLLHPEAVPAHVERVFWAGRDLIRMDHQWATAAGEPLSTKIRATIAELPAVRGIDDELNPVIAEKFLQTVDLSNDGYPHLTPVVGIPIYGHRLQSTGYRVTTQIAALRPESRASLRPAYRGIDDRLDLEEAWRIIEYCCPSVSRELVYLLIAAKGVSEAANSMPPMVFITGPAGAAKSSTITLAAAICGDHNTELAWVPDVGRVRQSILSAIDAGSYVTFNEITKVRLDSRAAMDLLLTLTPDSTAHRMFVGSVPFGRLPVFCWTDTEIAPAVKADLQLARRLTHCHLPARVDWNAPLCRSLGSVKNARLAGRIYADACDAILSYVIDRFFAVPQTFADIANALGFRSLEYSEERVEDDAVLLSFFNAVCSAPDLTGVDAERRSGPGWKLIHAEVHDALLDIWNQVRDGRMDVRFSDDHSRRCSAADWQKIIGARERVVFETRRHGASRLYVRFRDADTGYAKRTNAELRDL